MVCKWRSIGEALGIEHHDLEAIDKNYPDVNRCLTEVLSLWLKMAYDTKKYGKPTWQLLKHAVQSPAGGNNPALAENI